jgi:hypothetical protein
MVAPPKPFKQNTTWRSSGSGSIGKQVSVLMMFSFSSSPLFTHEHELRLVTGYRVHSKKQGITTQPKPPLRKIDNAIQKKHQPGFPRPQPSLRTPLANHQVTHTHPSRNPPRKNDHPNPLLLLRQGKPRKHPSLNYISQPREVSATKTAQVVGDLWMKYLKLIEEESPDVDDMDKERYVTSLSMILARKSKKKKGMRVQIDC